MYVYFLVGFLMFSVGSCQNQQQQTSNEVAENNVNLVLVSKSEEKKVVDKELVESFSDDSNIGLPKRNKIKLYNFKTENGNIVEIKFYSLANNKDWKLKQTFEFEKFGDLEFDPKIRDFSNDGFKDITYVSSVAARGANEVRKLFIYDEKNDELIYIKNSEDYPNMLYNKDLNCIDAWLFHGATTTVFLKIENDTLKEFASVDTGLERTVYVIENGEEKLLRKDKIAEDDIYVRYKNYNPPIPYQSDDFEN